MITASCKVKDEIDAPIADKIETKLTKHGDTRIDNYYWLNQRENPKVISYLEEENTYTEERLKHTKLLQDTLYKEIIGRIKPKDISVPYKDNGYYYYSRFEEHNEHPIYCRKKDNLNNSEEILLDVNKMSEGYPYYHVGDFAVSPDNKIITFSVDTVGRRIYEIRFKNLETGENLTELISETDGDMEWAADNKTVFYIKKDEETLREFQLWKHKFSEHKDDVLVYEEADETFYISVSKSKSDKYIFLECFNTLSTETLYIPADKPDANFKVILPRERKHEYSVETHNGELYILTNKNAVNFKIIKTSLLNPGIKNWTELIPHNPEVFIEDFEVFKNFIVVNERKNGLVFLRIIDLTKQTQHYINCGEEAYELWISDNDEYDTEILRYGYSSLTTPVSYFDYNMKTKEKILLKEKFAGSDFKKDKYTSKRIYAPTADGKKVPVSIVFRNDMPINENSPLLIYAYGSYGYSIDASFIPSVLSLLDRGFVFALAHVRGGQELGRDWYEDGKLLNKKNTFTDFITCTEYLHQLSYSSPQKTFAMGGSAGGLLTGVIANMRPDLYLGIIAEVPFIDVVTTMLDESVPLTTGEYDEWGNPNEKKYYQYMLSYSPYDQVKKQNYPAMFVTAGLHDSQVQYWEPAKWAAKLRAYNTGSKPIYLYTEMDAGHSGKTGRYQAHEETALIYAFMLDILKSE